MTSAGSPGASTSPPAASRRRPVAEPAGRVLGSDDQPGPDHHRRGGAVEHDPLAGHLHRAVRLRVLLEVDVLLDRLDQRQRRRRPAGRRVVGVHVDRRDEDPVRVGVRRHRVAHPRRVPRHVDDRVELTEVGQRLGPVDLDQRARPRAPSRRCPRAAQVTSCPRRHGVRRHRPRQEDRPTQHQESHAPTSHGRHARDNLSDRRSAHSRTPSRQKLPSLRRRVGRKCGNFCRLGAISTATSADSAGQERSGVVGLSSQSSKNERSTSVWSTSQSRYSSRAALVLGVAGRPVAHDLPERVVADPLAQLVPHQRRAVVDVARTELRRVVRRRAGRTPRRIAGLDQRVLVHHRVDACGRPPRPASSPGGTSPCPRSSTRRCQSSGVISSPYHWCAISWTSTASRRRVVGGAQRDHGLRLHAAARVDEQEAEAVERVGPEPRLQPVQPGGGVLEPGRQPGPVARAPSRRSRRRSPRCWWCACSRRSRP